MRYCVSCEKELIGRQLLVCSAWCNYQRPRYIFNHCRAKDKKLGFRFALTIEHVTKLIASGCSYCGTTRKEIAIGLDRKDNKLGHTDENVVASCVRCNLVRGTMPYEAWLVIAPAMKKAQELGLFGTWIPGAKKRNLALASNGDGRWVRSRDVAQPGSASALGAEGRWFESSHPDQFQ